MYEDRPKTNKDTQQLIDLYVSMGMFSYDDYIGVDAVCEYLKCSLESIAEAIQSGKLKGALTGTVGMGEDDEDQGLPFTRWEWVDEWKSGKVSPSPTENPIPVLDFTQYFESPDDDFGQPLKVGRNDPCPCDSGRKYKNCCGHPRNLH